MGDLGPRPSRRRALWILLGLSLLVCLPALRGPILTYDDAPLLIGPDGAVEKGPLSFFTDLYYYAYLPFYGLSYWIEGRIDGANPLVFHLGNVLWHAATCYVVFCVLGLLLGSARGALLGAALFAVHPLHVESFAWIAGRKDLVSGFFLFLAWLLVLKAEEGHPRATAWAVVSFLVACFAKASAVVLPGLLLAAALLLPRYAGRRVAAARAAIPFLVAALLPAAVHLWVGVHEGVVRDVASLAERARGGVWAWGWGLARTLVPVGLAIDYPEAKGGALALPAVLLAAAAAAAVALRRRAPEASFAIAAFLVALAPFNHVVPATDVVLADRYLYLSVFGLSAAAAWAAARLPAAVPGGAVVAAVLAVLSFASASRFAGDEELWTRTIASRDGSAVAYVNRGLFRTEAALTATPRDDALLGRGIDDLERGLARATLREHRAKASLGLVVPLREGGRLADAHARATDALALVEGSEAPGARAFRAQALYHRGIVWNDLGDPLRAAADFAESAKLRPRFDAWFECGRALLRAGRAEEARRALEQAAEHDPESPWPWLGIADVRNALGDREAAKQALFEAGRRAPRSEEVIAGWVGHWLRGDPPNYEKAHEELKRLDERSPLRRALAAEVDAQRALFHFRRGNAGEALEAADAALAQGLSKPAVLHELAQVYMDAGRYDDALRCFRSATDVLAQGRAYRDAAARAYAMKAYRASVLGDAPGARAAMRQALDLRPTVIEFGAAPLRGEVDMLREARDEDLPLLAAAVVAGDPARARDLAEALLDRPLADGDRLLVHRLRALSHAFASFDFAAAEADLTQVLAADPRDPWARYRMAEVRAREGMGWLRTGRQIGSAEREEEGRRLIGRAIGLLTELLEEDPDFHMARLQRGEAYFALRDDVGAKADYQYVRERDASVKEAYLREAVLHRLVYVEGGQKTNLDAALGILAEALRLDPNYFDALYEAGNVYHHLYDRQDDPSVRRRAAFTEAILHYRRAMAVNPRQKEPRVEWARICLKAAQEAVADPDPRGNGVARAHQLVARVEAEAADVPDVHRERARLNLREDFDRRSGLSPDEAFAGAAKALETLAALSPGDPELPRLRSLYHRRRGWSFYLTWIKLRDDPARRERARELAVEEWKRALDALPDDPELAGVRDRLREIAPDFIEDDRRRAEAAFRRGLEAFGEGRFEESVVAFRQASGYFPESAHLRYNLGLALARAGHLDEAREAFTLVANGPEGERFPEALYELGRLCLARREEATARVWFERHVAAMVKAGREDEPTVQAARAVLAGER